VTEKWKPTLAIDFDGVIHSYERGWEGGVIYGTVTPGFWTWADMAAERFELVVYSTRSADPVQLSAMRLWMANERTAYRKKHDLQGDDPLVIGFASEKPKAWLTIDDRAITFKGDWSAAELEPRAMMQFRPWNVGGGK
jgi:hypothetical protein